MAKNELIDTVITKKQSKFIDVFLETNDAVQALQESGIKYEIPKEITLTSNDKTRKQKTRAWLVQKAKNIKNNPAVQNELRKRLDARRRENSAMSGEVLFFLSEVMRGNIKDQFGFDAPLSERTRAAVELAKRTIDLENKVDGKGDAPTVQISINWKRD